MYGSSNKIYRGIFGVFLISFIGACRALLGQPQGYRTRRNSKRILESGLILNSTPFDRQIWAY